jgi:5-methylcytosine-specific restriction endonuclease McrA
MNENVYTSRLCLREPIPEIAEASRYLDQAISAYLAGHDEESKELVRRADMRAIRQWSESLWGKDSPNVLYRVTPNAPPYLKPEQCQPPRMPSPAVKSEVLRRDGYHCRFCGITVIRKEIREQIRKLYPDLKVWGRRNADQHAALQAMWLQYDHLLPHSRGGTNDPANVVITCAPCNYGRMQHTLEEVGLLDPLSRDPVRSTWDGLERLGR